MRCFKILLNSDTVFFFNIVTQGSYLDVHLCCRCAYLLQLFQFSQKTWANILKYIGYIMWQRFILKTNIPASYSYLPIDKAGVKLKDRKVQVNLCFHRTIRMICEYPDTVTCESSY